MTDAGIIRAFIDEIDALRAERDKFKQAFLEGSDKVVELRKQLAQAERDTLEGAEHDREIMNGQSAEIERLLVELTHRVGWEERCLRADAEVERLRAALEKIADASWPHDPNAANTAHAMQRVAAKALGRHIDG